MLKLPAMDICIESPRQNEYVDIVSNVNQNRYILGHGSYGRVYKAIYKDRPVAVKIIRKVNKETVDSVTRESNILGWNHENVIKILKITSLDDCFTIIMERFTGICLQQLLNQMQIPLWHRTKISIDVINGLCFCHAKNLVHLDVKPQNVFVAFGGDGSSKVSSSNYVCKLFDFGCSTFVSEESCSSNLRGTIRYMSPDILQGFNIGLHDDIYSFGITMWQLKSNADPYHSIPSNEIVAYHVVKNNLRPDAQLKHLGRDGKENENSEIMNSSGAATNGSVNNKSYGYHRIAIKSSNKLLTPNNIRKPFETQFLSTGHNRRHITVKSSISSNVVKKLDFNSMSNVNRLPLTSRSDNRSLSTVKHKINTNSEGTFDNRNVDAFFTDTCGHLSKERKMEIENSYENIYKLCWQQEANKRPSSPAILDSLNSTFHLFD